MEGNFRLKIGVEGEKIQKDNDATWKALAEPTVEAANYTDEMITQNHFPLSDGDWLNLIEENTDKSIWAFFFLVFEKHPPKQYTS